MNPWNEHWTSLPTIAFGWLGMTVRGMNWDRLAKPATFLAAVVGAVLSLITLASVYKGSVRDSSLDHSEVVSLRTLADGNTKRIDDIVKAFSILQQHQYVIDDHTKRIGVLDGRMDRVGDRVERVENVEGVLGANISSLDQRLSRLEPGSTTQFRQPR